MLQRLLIIPDTHVPYHDKKAWSLVMHVGKKWKPHTVLHGGDLMDFFSISRYSKDPGRKLTLKAEIEAVCEARNDMDRLKPKRKIMLGSNHGARLETYVAEHPELYDLLTETEALELPENNWEFYPYKDHCKIGKVYFTHDIGGSGKYTTMRALETYQHSVVIFHHHAMQYFVNGDATGQCQVGAQFGWLGDVDQIDYMHKIKARRNWALGFGIGYHDTSTGYVWLTPVPIVDYSCIVEGKLYSV